MTISEETRLLNFIVNILIDHNLLKYGVVEYKIHIPNFGTVNPDFFAYLISNKNIFDLNCYIIFEFKKRTVARNSDFIKLQNQYSGFNKIRSSHLDSSKIPVISSIPIFLNYIFYNTPTHILNSINNHLNFDENCSILYYHTSNRTLQNFKNPVNPIFKTLTQLLVDNSSKLKYWKRFRIPFTIKDLDGIKGLGGNQSNIKIDPKTSYSIIISHLCSFILQRKIQKKESKFHIDQFFDFLFLDIKNIIYIEDDEKKSIIKKLALFLNFISYICNELDFKFIEIVKPRFYSITLKKSESLATRISSIRSLLIQKISSMIRQREITEFLE